MSDYSLKIKEIRSNFKLTQDQFATALGVSRSTISQIEIGKFLPTLELIADIARIYHINTNWLISDLGVMFLSENNTLNNSNDMNCNECPYKKDVERYQRDLARYENEIEYLHQQLQSLRNQDNASGKQKCA